MNLLGVIDAATKDLRVRMETVLWHGNLSSWWEEKAWEISKGDHDKYLAICAKIARGIRENPGRLDKGTGQPFYDALRRR